MKIMPAVVRCEGEETRDNERGRVHNPHLCTLHRELNRFVLLLLLLLLLHCREEAERAKSEASRLLREKDALRERVAALQSATDRSAEAAEAATRDRNEARMVAATAAQRAQQERERLAEMEGENEGLRTRLQMAEEELGSLAADADEVRIG